MSRQLGLYESRRSRERASNRKRRKGMGRKPLGARSRRAHVRRPRISGREPLHVTVRVRRDLPRLRFSRAFAVVKQAISGANERVGFAVRHFTLQGNHLHLIVEAADKRMLSGGMRAVQIRIALGFNKLLKRVGSVFDGRYHVEVLETPTQVRNALTYVLLNARRHAKQLGKVLPKSFLDPFSSARLFDGWKNLPSDIPTYGVSPPDLEPPCTWLLSTGWRRKGLIDPTTIPSG